MTFSEMNWLDRILFLKRIKAESGIEKTVTGNPITVTDALSAKVKSLMVNLEPIQDLHGQDAPYPAGASVNKLNPDTVTTGKKLNNVGELTDGSAYCVSDWIPVEPNTDYCAEMVIAAANGYAFCFYDANKNFLKYEVLSGTTPISGVRNSGADAAYARITVQLASLDSALFAQSSSMIPFVPYSNICPISGRQSMTVTRAGKNLLSTTQSDYRHPTSAASVIYEPSDMVFADGEFSGTVPSGYRDTCVFTQKVPFKAGTYTLSCDYINGSGNTSWTPIITSYYNNNNWYTGFDGFQPKASATSGHISKTFTATKDFYVNICLNSFGNAANTAVNKLYNLQLEYASSASDYVLHERQSVTVEFPALGKNLLNLDRTAGSPGASGKTTPRNFSESEYYPGMASDNSVAVTKISEFSKTDTSISFKSATTAYGVGFPLRVVEGVTYTLSFTGGGEARYVFYDANGNYVRVVTGKTWFTVESGEAWVNVLFRASTADTLTTFSNIQLEVGSTPTSYEPYTNMVYGGSLDVTTGALTITHVKWSSIGKNDWRVANDTYIGQEYSRAYTDTGARLSNFASMYCNYLPRGTMSLDGNHFSLDGNRLTHTILSNSLTGIVYGADTRQDAITKFKAYFAEHPIEFVYVAETPFTVQLTPQQLKLLNGTNNVWSDGNDITMTYKAKKE